MITSSLMLSIVCIFLFVLLIKDNTYFNNIVHVFQGFWFYDYITVIIIIGIVPYLNVLLFLLIVIYSFYRLLKIKGI